MELSQKFISIIIFSIGIILLSCALIFAIAWLTGAKTIREYLFRKEMKRIGHVEIFDYTKYPQLENNFIKSHNILLKRAVFKHPTDELFKVFELRSFGQYKKVKKYEIR